MRSGRSEVPVSRAEFESILALMQGMALSGQGWAALLLPCVDSDVSERGLQNVVCFGLALVPDASLDYPAFRGMAEAERRLLERLWCGDPALR